MTASQGAGDAKTLAIVGGGLAGLAAAVAATQNGLHVELFEQAKTLGGRAGSFYHPRTGGWVDFSPHVSLGCCTNLADLCRRTGLADAFRTHRVLHFIGPKGGQFDVAATPGLPAPLHLLPSLLRLGYLTFREKWDVARALRKLAQEPLADTTGGETAAAWLRRHNQSERAIERFWSLVLESALAGTAERVSLSAAAKVFRDGFLAARSAYVLRIPQRPLAEIWARVATWLTERGAAVHLRSRVRQIDGNGRRAAGLIFQDGSRRTPDRIVLAVHWQQVRRLLPPEMRSALPALEQLEQIEAAPITTANFWFDRPLGPLPHAALAGRLSQWVFARSVDQLRLPTAAPQTAHHYQVVISGAGELLDRSREKVLAEVRHDLKRIWPAAREARLLYAQLLTRRAAVFAMRPGVNGLRPPQRTPVENLFLAGDWTATGWPGTMEGAVRSGYLAAEALLDGAGPRRILVPDLPRALLARWLCG
ncbi:MAG: hydroxysqualene dehydroxylase HpnE [Thermoguttaceae bacterium]